MNLSKLARKSKRAYNFLDKKLLHEYLNNEEKHNFFCPLT